MQLHIIFMRKYNCILYDGERLLIKPGRRHSGVHLPTPYLCSMSKLTALSPVGYFVLPCLILRLEDNRTVAAIAQAPEEGP